MTDGPGTTLSVCEFAKKTFPVTVDGPAVPAALYRR